MNKFFTFLIIFFAVCVAQSKADSDEFQIEGSNIFRFDAGNEVGYQLLADYPDNTLARRFAENRLRLDIYRGNLRVGGRFLYFRPSVNDKRQYVLENEIGVDKRYLTADINPFKMRFGHFSDIWGNGLALSAYENRELYFDTELDGLHLQAEAGPLTIIGLRGTSKKGIFVEEADLTAARAKLMIGNSGLGFNYVFIDSNSYPETHVSSIDWRLEKGIFSFYGERAWNKQLLTLNDHEGHATYAGFTVTKWNWSLLGEYKDYDYGLATPFQNPPTATREIGPRLLQGREPHVMNVPDEVGVQAELSGSISEKTYMTLHYNASSRHQDKSEFIPLPSLKQDFSPYWEFFANVVQQLPRDRSLTLELGLNEEAAAIWQKRLWYQFVLKTPLKGSQEIELEVEGMQVTDKLRDDEKFFDHLYSLTFDTGNNISFNAQYQLTNDDVLKKREGKGWPSVEVATSFGNGKHRMIAFYGRERGGLKCSNGVCRQVQAFSGFRLTLETSL